MVPRAFCLRVARLARRGSGWGRLPGEHPTLLRREQLDPQGEAGGPAAADLSQEIRGRLGWRQPAGGPGGETLNVLRRQLSFMCCPHTHP